MATHRGRIFKVTGDGVIIEFGSAVNAVHARSICSRNGESQCRQTEDRQIVLRIGVNLGDIMVEGSDLYGDGINIAARLEALAEPGGILVSGTAYDHIKSKIKVGFDDLGAQTLKNMAEPVRAYRVASTATLEPTTSRLVSANRPSPYCPSPICQAIQSRSISRTASPRTLSRSCLVFAPCSSSHEIHRSNIKARMSMCDAWPANSACSTSSKAVCGRWRRVRITAQLIDSTSGNHLWSERYDRNLDDIFVVQDEVLHSIAACLEGRLASSIADNARRKPTEHLAAYDCVLQARHHLNTYAGEVAEPLLTRAIDLDPNYAQAYAYLAWATLINYFLKPTPALLDESLQLARKAAALDSNDAACQSVLGFVQTFKRDFDEAGSSLERAFALNSSDAIVITTHAHWLSRVGRHAESLAGLDLALQRNPFPPSWYWEGRSIPLFALKRYDEAIQSVKRQDRLFFWSYAYLAACYAMMGKMGEARAAAVEVLRMQPDFTIRMHMVTEPFMDPSDSEHEVEGLRKAGLPE